MEVRARNVGGLDMDTPKSWDLFDGAGSIPATWMLPVSAASHLCTSENKQPDEKA